MLVDYFTLAGVATPLKGEVSSEMLYLLHTRSGMFQLTMKGWSLNSGAAVWGRDWGGGSLGWCEVVVSGGEGKVSGKGTGDVLAR